MILILWGLLFLSSGRHKRSPVPNCQNTVLLKSLDVSKGPFENLFCVFVWLGGATGLTPGFMPKDHS